MEGGREDDQSPNNDGRVEAKAERITSPTAGAKAEILRRPVYAPWAGILCKPVEKTKAGILCRLEVLGGWDPLQAEGVGRLGPSAG